MPTQWFVVTDLGLATLQGADGLHVFVRALSSAEARAGVAVTLVARNNEVLGTAVTDAEGRAQFDPGLLRGRGGAEAELVNVAAEGDFAFLSLAEPGFDLSDRGVEGRPAPPPVDVFVTTERGAYRPGETVYATILARDAAAQAITGLPLTAIVTRADGVEFGRFTLPDEGAGGRALTMRLDPGAPTGGWRLAVYADPQAPALGSTGFLVEDFVPERLDMTLTLAEGPVDPAVGAVLEAQTDFLFGAPGADLPLEGDVMVSLAREVPGHDGYVFGLEDEPFGTAYAQLPAGLTTDAEGAARIELPMPQVGPVSRPLQLTATLRVRDGSGRPVERSVTRPMLSAAPLIGVRPLFDGAVDQGASAGFEVIALGPDLARVGAGAGGVGAVAGRHDVPVVRGRRQLELRADHPARAGGERVARSRGGRAGDARPAGGLGQLRAAAGDDGRAADRDEPRVRRRLGRRRGRGGDAGHPRPDPRPRGLCGGRRGAGAHRRAERRAGAGGGARRPADRDAGAEPGGRRDRGRAAGDRGLGLGRLCDGDADPADGRGGAAQPGAGDRARLGRGRSRGRGGWRWRSRFRARRRRAG